MLQNPIINGLFSIFLVIVVCFLLGLNNKDIFVIILISVVVIFVFHIIADMNKYYNQRINNIENPDILLTKVKNIYNNSNNLSINTFDGDIDNSDVIHNSLNAHYSDNMPKGTRNTNKLNNNNLNVNNNKIPQPSNNNIPYHLKNSPDKIIDAKMYNLEDCTTDKSCLIKPDENNLHPGFDLNKNNNRNDNYMTIRNNKKPKKLCFQIRNKKMDNKLSIEENVVVEQFTNNKTPEHLNDIVKPFNKTIINPYEQYGPLDHKNQKCKKIPENDEELCYHCKVGSCEGGVCIDKNEVKYGIINDLPDKIISDSIKDVHPYSDDFQTIRATNPETAL